MGFILDHLKEDMKYIPPDFRLFEQKGCGLLAVADRALGDLIMSFVFMRGVPFEKYPQWKVLGGHQAEDLVTMYGAWAKADDIIRKLNCMDPKERQKHIDLDTQKISPTRSYEEIENEFVKYTGEIAAWEYEYHDIVYPTLDRHLRERLDLWEKYLHYADEDPAFLDRPCLGDHLEDIEEFCMERTLLEYVREGIESLQIRGFLEYSEFDRMEPLPYFRTFEKRLEELDTIFRRVAHGRHDIEIWADPTFWWHHPEKEENEPPRGFGFGTFRGNTSRRRGTW